MSGWGTDDVDYDDTIDDDASGWGTPAAVAVDTDGLATGTPATPAQTAPTAAPSTSTNVVPLRDPIAGVAPGAQLVPTNPDDPATVQSKRYLAKFAPQGKPALSRAMSGLLHEVHTLSNGTN